MPPSSTRVRARRGYSFLTELSKCSCQQISIETAQSNLDCSVLQGLAGQNHHPGCRIDLSDMNVETPETDVAARIRKALEFVPAENIIVAPEGYRNTCRARWPTASCAPWWPGPSRSFRREQG